MGLKNKKVVIEKFVRGNWYVTKDQKKKLEGVLKEVNKGKKGKDRVSESDIIRFLITNMRFYEKK
jgi:hypothetical protein